MKRLLATAFALLLAFVTDAAAQSGAGPISNPRPLTAQAIQQALGYTPGRGQWYAASGAPSPAIGQSGDLYLRTDTGQVYQNAAGTWTAATNITGPTGATGATGQAAWTTTAAGFTMPASLSTVSVGVGSTAWMTAGAMLYVGSAGYMTVTSVTTGTTAVLTNTGLAGNAGAGTAIPSAVMVTPSGAPGAGSVASGATGAVAGYPSGGTALGPITALPNGTTATTQAALDNSTQVATNRYVDSAVAAGVPSGVVMPFAGTAAPAGYFLCAGQAVSRTTYATLFAAIGTTWGPGDGTTTFNLPDLRGRAAFGADNMGGTAANRLGSNSSSGGISGTAALGVSGGAQTHIQTGTELAAHQHTGPGGGTFAMANSGTFFFNYPTSGTTGSYVGYSGNTELAGNSAAMNITPPALVLNYIIKQRRRPANDNRAPRPATRLRRRRYRLAA